MRVKICTGIVPEMIEPSNISLKKLKPGQFVIAMYTYDCDWYLGNVMEIALDHEDVYLDFLTLKGPAQSFSWLKRKDQCWVRIDNIIMEIDHMIYSAGRQYSLNKPKLNQINYLAKRYFEQNL